MTQIQTRPVQVNLNLDVITLLAKIMAKRIELGFAPGKTTKTVIVADAIRCLAVHELGIGAPSTYDSGSPIGQETDLLEVKP